MVNQERAYGGIVNHLQHTLYPLGEPKEVNVLSINTVEEATQFFADYFAEPSLHPHLMKLVEEMSGIEDVYGLGIVAMYTDNLSLKIIAEKSSIKCIRPTMDSYRGFTASHLAIPESKVRTNMSYILITGSETLPKRLEEIYDRFRRNEGFEAWALITFQKPS